MTALVVDVVLRDRVLETVPFDRPTLRVGRMPENDVAIDNLGVSRFHARLELEEGGVVLEDAGSENGCFVNGERVVGRRAVAPGDRIAIGKHELRLRAAAPDEQTDPRPARRKGDAWDGARTVLVEIAGTTTRTASPAGRSSRSDRKEAAPMRDANAEPEVLDGEPMEVELVEADVEDGSGAAPAAPVADGHELDFAFDGSLAEEAEVPPAPLTPPPAPALHAGFLVQRNGKLECVAPWTTDHVVAGRSADCDLVLSQEEVSRRHARFERTGDRFEVVDLGSVNGTFVNGRRADRSALHVGDVIQIEGFQLTFVLDREPLESAVAAPAPRTAAAAAPPENDRFAMTMLQEEMPHRPGFTAAVERPPVAELPEGELFGEELEEADAPALDEKPDAADAVAVQARSSSRASSVQDLRRVSQPNLAGREVVLEVRLRLDLLPPALRDALDQVGASDLVIPAELRLRG